MKCLSRRWRDLRVGEWGPFAALPTSQLIIQPFRCFTYVIGTSPTSQLILQTFRRFTYSTAHSKALALLHLRIGTSPTSQFIQQPFRRFIYATVHSTTLPPLHIRHRLFYNPSVASPTSHALHVHHLANCPRIGGWKNRLCWTSFYSKLLSLEVATVLDSC